MESIGNLQKKMVLVVEGREPKPELNPPSLFRQLRRSRAPLSPSRLWRSQTSCMCLGHGKACGQSCCYGLVSVMMPSRRNMHV